MFTNLRINVNINKTQLWLLHR